MKNKKLIYGALFAGAIVAIYMWDKNNKSKCSCSSCSSKTDSYSNLTGRMAMDSGVKTFCTTCQRPDKTYYTAVRGACASKDNCVSHKTVKTLI